jgi:hypothetical protein
MFLGWPRSGHSLVGACIDAHPDAVIAHELDALSLVREGVTRDELLALILLRAAEFAEMDWRWEGRAFHIPGGAQSATSAPRIFGDKKGGATTRQLKRDPTLLEELRATVDLPLRVIHVVRHPLDVITSMALRKPKHPLSRIVDGFFAAARTNDEVLAQLSTDQVCVLRFEEFVADPRHHLTALCRFLGLDVLDEHLEACAHVVLPSPPTARHRIAWTPELRAAVSESARAHPHLAGYAYGCEGEPDDPDNPPASLSAEDGQRLTDVVHRFAVQVDQPLVLVSQVQRSGGTLLSQLFDGHPELHAHPHELAIGNPTKYHWPRVPADGDPQGQLAVVREERHARLFGDGYAKQLAHHIDSQRETFAFLQPPSLVDALYTRLAASGPPAAPREVLNRYFTAYFNAWLDNANLRSGPKRWVTAFTPRLAWGESRTRFVSDYPDGRLISVIRDPYDWYASARLHQQRYEDCRWAADLWRHSTDETLAAWRERPAQTLVLRFEDLAGDTARVMARVAQWLGIANLPSLSEPTFNGRPISANSSFRVPGSGIRPEAVGRGRSELSAKEVAILDDVCADTYARALADPALAGR